jgi:non-specific protein-tyrosine kinase
MSELATLTEPRSAVAEAYRVLRTNLPFARPGEALSTLLVTSPGAVEDKSTVLANLAVVLAQSGRRVLVMDCDMRRPAQHRLFGLANDRGTSTLLAADGPPDGGAVQSTDVPGLTVLASGPLPPNPAELLGTPRMGEVLAALAARADIVLVDAPPVVPVTDAAEVAPLVDGVLLVLAAGRSRRDQTQRAREILDRVRARVLGVVLTGVAPEAVQYGTYPSEEQP